MQEEYTSPSIIGKFHSGFLKRAEMFPIHRILSDHQFKNMDIVVCGYSIGGAIASIVAIKLFIGLKHRFQKRLVKCITFGAPPVGDQNLQQFVAQQMSPYIYNFVNINDPVPKLLMYTQFASAWLQSVEVTVSRISEVSAYKTLVAIKPLYRSVIDTIDVVMRIVEATVNERSAVEVFQTVFSVICDATKAIKDNRNVCIPIGNFQFLSENAKDNYFFSCDSLKELQWYMQMKYQLNANEASPNAHSLSHYVELFHKSFPVNDYPSITKQLQSPQKALHADNVDQNIQFKNPFRPLIYSVGFTIVRKRKNRFLKLSFTGKYIHNVVLDLCQFSIPFAFAINMEEVKIKELSMGKYMERLVIEQIWNEGILGFSHHGQKLLLVTQFGECDKILLPKNVRDSFGGNVSQIAENDSVSLVLRRAIQRGMALKKIEMESGYASSEQIIDEIVQLGTVSIGEDEMKKKKTQIFTEYVEKIDIVFSNEKSFQNVKDFCVKIEEYIRSPFFIETELTSNVKNVAMTAFAGGISVPFLALKGIAEMTSLGDGFSGGFAANATSTFLNDETLTDSNYKKLLSFFVQELLEAHQESLSATAEAEITDLIDEDNIFSNEEVLLRLAAKNIWESFGDCSISNFTRKNKEEVVKRIKVIRSIHRIRKIFSQQCFIGVVGLQNAGKTTLVKKIWNVGGKPGNFNHTSKAEMYQITQKLLVVDFPGNDSLRHYSKTFSICGAMNNIIIAVIPFSGDANKNQSQEIAKIFEVKKGSKSTKVILCINKCGPFLAELRQELSLQKKPVDYLKQDFVNKLNDYYEENEISVHLSKVDILLTDWELERNQESLDFGINGVEEIKQIIRDYLVDYGIYKSTETDELEKCVSFVSN